MYRGEMSVLERSLTLDQGPAEYLKSTSNLEVRPEHRRPREHMRPQLTAGVVFRRNARAS